MPQPASTVVHRQFSVFFHRTRLKSRYILSILVGLTLGFVLSLACLPMMSICENSMSFLTEPLPFQSNNENLSLREKFDPFGILIRHARSIADVTLVDYRSKDYEPKIHPLQPAPVIKSNNPNKTVISSTHPPNAAKLARPRYIADELGIREKVLVAVLAETSRLNTFAFFLNQTLQDHVNRLLFFIDDDVDSFPHGMQVVAIHDQRVYLKPFYVLKYLAEKMIKSYDWFFLVPDNTYIRGFKVSHRSKESTNSHLFFSSSMNF